MSSGFTAAAVFRQEIVSIKVRGGTRRRCSARATGSSRSATRRQVRSPGCGLRSGAARSPSGSRCGGSPPAAGDPAPGRAGLTRPGPRLRTPAERRELVTIWRRLEEPTPPPSYVRPPTTPSRTRRALRPRLSRRLAPLDNGPSNAPRLSDDGADRVRRSGSSTPATRRGAADRLRAASSRRRADPRSIAR